MPQVSQKNGLPSDAQVHNFYSVSNKLAFSRTVSIVFKTQACLLASFNLTPWHLLKSHPVSLANSSRVNYPLSCFMADIFYETMVGFPALRGQASLQWSEWTAHFPSMAWKHSFMFCFFFFFSCRRHRPWANLADGVKPLSASPASDTEHPMSHHELDHWVKSPQRKLVSPKDLFQRNWK